MLIGLGPIVEIWQLISTYSPGVAVGVLCLYFYNQFVIRTLDERKEWLDERKSWMGILTNMVDRYEKQVAEMVIAHRDSTNEDHALRGKVHEMMVTIDSRIRALEMYLHEKKP